MPRLWRVPRTWPGLVGQAALLAGAVNLIIWLCAGGIGTAPLAIGFLCSFVSFVAFLRTLPVAATDRSKQGAEADRRGMAELTAFLHTGRPLHLDLAVKLLGFSAQVTPEDDPARAGHLSNLASALSTRYGHTGQPADLDASITADRLAVEAAADGSVPRAMMRSDLAGSLVLRYQRTGDLADLDGAVDTGRAAVAAFPEGHERLPLALSNLGGALAARYERLGAAADIDEAVESCAQAVRQFPEEEPVRGVALANLAAARLEQFRRSGDPAHLEASIDAGRDGLAALPPGHPNQPANLLNLGMALSLRFRHSRQAADIDAAVDLCRRAVAARGPHHPDRGLMQFNLGSTLYERYLRTRSAGDLGDAIAAARDAARLLPPGSPHHAGNLSNLALALVERFAAGAGAADLGDAGADAAGADAADLGDAGADAAGADAAGLGAAGLGDAGVDTADLDAAIEAGRAAVAAAPPDDPDRGLYLSTLAVAWRSRHEHTRQPADLDEAVATTEAALDATPPGHPDRAAYLNNLGFALKTRHELSGDDRDLRAAIAHQRQAAGIPTAPPLIRLKAAWAWGGCAFLAGEPASASTGLAAAVHLLPRVAWHGLDRPTREDQLTTWYGLAADAAAAAVAAGHPELAVELLEQGRSVLWTQTLHLRGDLSQLADQAPDLYAELDRIRAALDRPATVRLRRSAPDAADDPDERRRLARRWDDLLARARALPGLGHLLAPVPFAELRPAAADGHVVIVNASRYGCHALLIGPGEPGVRVLDLPALTRAAALDRAAQLHDIVARDTGPGAAARPLPERERDRHALLDLLDWLWDTVTRPVLDALGHGPVPGGATPPRLWWCPTGPLTMLPLHAAGRHTRTTARPTPAADTVPGRVVSSYTPTLAALLRARAAAGRPAAPVRQLVAGLAETPGQPPLPAVPQELAALAARLPPPAAARHLTGAQATRDRVLAEIGRHPWLHLACHATQHDTDPSAGGFALWDGRLTITDLAAARVPDADLAYLSACRTATGSPLLADESVHLAAAMLLLGYRHVVGTLWSVHDATAPLIAGAFYETLPTGRDVTPLPAARALHDAVARLRAHRPADPLLWAPYLHIGA